MDGASSCAMERLACAWRSARPLQSDAGGRRRAAGRHARATAGSDSDFVVLVEAATMRIIPVVVIILVA